MTINYKRAAIFTADLPTFTSRVRSDLVVERWGLKAPNYWLRISIGSESMESRLSIDEARAIAARFGIDFETQVPTTGTISENRPCQ